MRGGTEGGEGRRRPAACPANLSRTATTAASTAGLAPKRLAQRAAGRTNCNTHTHLKSRRAVSRVSSSAQRLLQRQDRCRLDSCVAARS